MVDTVSSVRRAGENLLTPLGFAPSGSPSGSPWPTGSQSYASDGALVEHDSLTVVKYHVQGVVLGATGPQPSGFGFYQSIPDVEVAPKDLVSRLSMARPGFFYTIGTSPLQPTGGYYSPGEAPQSPHDSPSIADKTLSLPVTSGSGGTLYRLRARDAAGPLNDPTRFVYWTSAVVSLSSYTGPLPFGGPLVELTTLDSWISGT